MNKLELVFLVMFFLSLLFMIVGFIFWQLSIKNCDKALKHLDEANNFISWPEDDHDWEKDLRSKY